MRIPLFKRVVIALLNVFFPPLAVYLLCGMGPDLLMNCLLFLLAVIPSHIHGFYISLTYFHRKGKVRRGVYPGGSKRLISAEKVIQGGADGREYARLKAERDSTRFSRKLLARRQPTAPGSGHSSPMQAVEEWDDGWKEYGSRTASLSRASTGSRSGRPAAPARTSTRARRRDGRLDDYA